MVAANLHGIAAKSAGMPFAARSGVVLVKVDHLMRHGANQRVGMLYSRRGYADNMFAVFAHVPTEQRRIAHDAKFYIIAVRQVPPIEWTRFVQEIVAGAERVGGHVQSNQATKRNQPHSEFGDHMAVAHAATMQRNEPDFLAISRLIQTSPIFPPSSPTWSAPAPVALSPAPMRCEIDSRQSTAAH